MNKNLLYLSLVSLFAFSLTSCGGHERRIDVDTGEELLEVAGTTTKDYFDHLAMSNFIANDLALKIEADINIKNEKISDESITKETDLAFRALCEHKSNMDLADLRSEEATLANTSSYSMLDYSILHNEEVIANQSKMYQTAKKVTTLTDGDSFVDTIDQKDVENFLDNLNFFIYDLSTENLIKLFFPNISNVKYDRFMYQYEKFKNEEIDAQEFIDYVDFYILDGDLFSNSVAGTYECCVKLLENMEEFLPNNYFDYTKLSDSNFTTIKGKFDYKDWSSNAAKTIKQIIDELEENNTAYELINNLHQDLIDILPSEITFNFAITIDKNNVIKNIKLDFKTNGSIKNSSITSAEERLLYNINLSVDFAFAFFNEPIKLPTLELTEKQ